MDTGPSSGGRTDSNDNAKPEVQDSPRIDPSGQAGDAAISEPHIHTRNEEQGESAKDMNSERFIQTLQACFADLANQNGEQLNRLQMAVEELKPKTPVMDTKTKFWNMYKTLSDEHDREFLQKCSTDLDTSLIFAGLFSAVSSAFIIQIQPELQPDPNEINQALMRILIHGSNSSLFPNAETAILAAFVPSSLVLTAQILLYISLSCTLLAALLAVLGKQWLMYYTAAGERGSIDARGLERQRKLDALHRWRFDPVMQMFPLLLQLALLLFAVALSIYLWTIHNSLAITVLILTSFGSIAYVFLLASAVISPDSPFQTPIAPLMVSLLLWMNIFFGGLRSYLLPYSLKVKTRSDLEVITSFSSIPHVVHIPASSRASSPTGTQSSIARQAHVRPRSVIQRLQHACSSYIQKLRDFPPYSLQIERRDSVRNIPDEVHISGVPQSAGEPFKIPTVYRSGFRFPDPDPYMPPSTNPRGSASRTTFSTGTSSRSSGTTSIARQANVRPTSRVIQRLHHACSNYIQRIRDFRLYSLYAHTTKTKFKDTILFCSHPKKVDVVTPRLFDAPTPSTEITAVAWVLETSTDPHTLRIAAEMAVNLQWPMATDPRPHLSRLLDSFFGCFDSSVIFDSKTQSQRRLLTSLRDGMHSHAIHFGRAYCSLRCLQSFETDANSEHFTGADFELGPGLPNELELENVFSILRGWPYLIISPAPHFQPALKWALHVIPSIPHPQGRSRSLHSFLEQFDQAIPRLNLQCFSDYLFCLICYMSSTTNNHDILLMNKSEYAAQLYEDLLKTLLANLHTGRISMYQGAYIVTTTGRLWVEHIQDYHSTVFRPAQSSMFAFCESLPRKEGWLNVVAAAGIFIQDCSEERFRGSSSVIPQSLIQNWAHDALALQRLGHLGDPYTATGIAGLFNALLSYGCSPGVESRPLIVKSLSMPGHISQNATRLLLKEDFTKWFQDEDASPILQRASIWTFLTRNALRDPAIVGVYIELGRTLLGIPAPWQVHMNNTPDYSREWHSLLHAEFSCDWITIFFRSNWQVHPWHWDEGTSLLNTNTSYIEVLHEIWQPDLGRCPFALDHAQRACGLSLVVLFKLWTDFDFRTESNSVVSLLRSTSWTALRPSSSFITNENNADFEQVYFIPLRDRLIQTGTTLGIQFETDDCSEDTSVERKVPNEILRWIVAILEDLARRIPINLGPVWRHEYHVYWRNLRWEFDASLDELEKALQPWISLDPQVIDKRPFRVPLPESSRGDGSNSSVSTHSYVSFP